MKNKTLYTISKLAKIADISVRTLRHYDQIGILKPSSRNTTGHRVYGGEELMRLQQILFFRELEFSLREIKPLLKQDNLDLRDILLSHKVLLQEKNLRIKRLIKTIDKTILHFKKRNMLTDEELYEGFSKGEIEQMKKEVREKYDPKVVAESNRNVAKMTKEQFTKVKKEAGDNALALAKAMESHKASDTEVQELVLGHYNHIKNFYTPNKEMYKGLGNLYVQDARFTAFYDKIKPGLAAFLNEAIEYFCDNNFPG